MKKEKIGLNLILVFFVLGLGVALHSDWVLQLDLMGNDWLRLTPSHELTAFFRIISRFGNHLTLIAVTLLIFSILCLLKKFKQGFWFAVTMAVNGTLVPFALKNIFGRPRPSDGLFTRTGFSFPSGHSTGATIFYGMLIILALIYLKKKWQRRLACLVLSLIILLILWSRVYLGYHFTTDVAASLFLGAGQLFFSHSFLEITLMERLKLESI